MDYYVRSAMLERYQRYTTKMTQLAELKTSALTMWNDLPQEFIDKKN